MNLSRALRIEHAGQEARLAGDLEAVADRQHEAALRGVARAPRP